MSGEAKGTFALHKLVSPGSTGMAGVGVYTAVQDVYAVWDKLVSPGGTGMAGMCVHCSARRTCTVGRGE